MRAIPSAPGYWATSDGEICRTRRLSPTSNGKGYLRVTVSINGKPSTRYIHRLVAEAYHGPCPIGWQARHLNGERNDNRPENLAWSDKLTNEGDKKAHGTLPTGERNPMAKMTAAAVTDARERAKAGEPIADIARSMGVPRATLADAIMGRRWRDQSGALEPYSTRRKFSDDQVREIRRRAETETKKAIAKEFGVVPSAISVIVSGKTYGHVK